MTTNGVSNSLHTASTSPNINQPVSSNDEIRQGSHLQRTVFVTDISLQNAMPVSPPIMQMPIVDMDIVAIENPSMNINQPVSPPPPYEDMERVVMESSENNPLPLPPYSLIPTMISYVNATPNNTDAVNKTRIRNIVCIAGLIITILGVIIGLGVLGLLETQGKSNIY